MAEAEIDNPEKSLVARLVPRRKRWRVSLAAILLVLAGVLWLWTQREELAADFVAEQLAGYGIPARYEVESIAPDRQVLTGIVLGDPARPDLTADQAVVTLRYGFGLPRVRSVTLVRPRLYGTWRKGQLSFGSLDRFLFAESDEPPGLPNLDLRLIDGRALLETEAGPIGIKAEGQGWLPGGFSGILAASAPQLTLGGCRVGGASLYGRVSTATGQASFAGPVRLAALSCADEGLALAGSSVALEATASPTFARLDARGQVALGALAAPGVRLARTRGGIEATLTGQGIDSRFDLEGEGLRHDQASLASLALDGALRARDGFGRVTLDAEVAGTGLAPGAAFERQLAGLAGSAGGTLAAPLLDKLRANLRRALPGSTLAGNIVLRQDEGVTRITVPAAALRSRAGEALASFSRVRLVLGEAGLPRLSGNVVTGGAGLPRIAGRMEQVAGGRSAFRLRMDDYAAGTNRIAVPQLFIAQGRDGALGFSGSLVASGLLPGGEARNLRLPVDGSLAADGTALLWPRCTRVSFDRLKLAALELDRDSLALCPGSGGAIATFRNGRLSLAAGVSGLDLAGELAGTPVRIASGPAGFAWPGALSARAVEVTLGPPQATSRFGVADLGGRLGSGGLAGSFADADIELAAVPLDLRQAGGSWQMDGGALRLTGVGFELTDRQPEARFSPLAARDAELTLADNRVSALARLRHPGSDRVVADVRIAHDLAAGAGHADLVVDGLQFDDALQPDQLSDLALGVIANVRGAVSGTGRIDWSGAGVTSSGLFETDDLDFAAAFGPVRGASGTIRFTDLLNLTTAPGQVLRVQSVNPGIEVLEGTVGFALADGRRLDVSGGQWPFMGGTLTIDPVTLNLGAGEERRYIFRVEGLEAARFVQQLELGNISATGTFDGVLPIVFDEMVNGRIEGGYLESRLPGGNVSYVGDLTYEDLGAVANFAFAALRSLDYRTMNIRMDGPLTGEIVTRVRFDGVSQGEGARQNFITRQIADLPVRFNVNVRAPFYQLITSIRAMYDPAFIRDPRELGLLSSDGERLTPRASPDLPATRPDDAEPDERAIQTQAIQTQESENVP